MRLLNTSFLTLIRKKDGVVHVNDFRPINLIHSFAKLVTILMANWLAGRLQEIVSTN